MLHVDEGAGAAELLGFGDDVLADGGLAGGFRAVDLGDAAARDAADAEGDVQREGAGGDGFDRHVVGFAQAHDRAVAVALGDIAEGFIQGDLAGGVFGFVGLHRGHGGGFFGHRELQF